MRKTLTLFFALGIHWIAQGQNNFCGTNSDPVYLSKYPALIAEARKQSTSSRVNTLYIPVFYHLIGKSDKSGVKRLSEVLASHCELNQNFLPSKIQFYIVGIDSIFDDSYYQFPDFSTGDDVMNSFNVDDVCNIYVNKNPAGVCGYAFFPNSGPNGGGIFINESCYGTGTTTLTHEMGHYCGLPHTFESWGGVEFVNGTNCANAGDYFCDTPADFLDYRWTCPYNGNQTDPNGDLYRTVLDGAFYMSYANDGCHKKFSPDQQGYMYGTIQSQRAALIANSFTGFVPLDSVKVIQPTANDSNIAADYAFFKWHKVAGAQFYILEIPGISIQPLVDIAVSDTFVAVRNLAVNKAYKYRVMPVAFNNNCNRFNSPTTFKTSPIRLNAAVKDIYCGLPDDGSIVLNPVSGTAPYHYKWSTGDSTKSLTRLTAGTYNVTVNDSSGIEVISQFTVNSYAPINNNFSKSGNRLIANVTGGFPPYTYDWANGGTANFYAPLVIGQYYSVRVTDSRGCWREFDLVYNAVQNVENFNFSVNVFPNPIAEHQLSFSVNSDNNDKLECTIMDVQGKVVKAIHLKGNVGEQQFKLGLNELNSGMYVLHIKNGENSISKRFAVE